MQCSSSENLCRNAYQMAARCIERAVNNLPSDEGLGLIRIYQEVVAETHERSRESLREFSQDPSAADTSDNDLKILRKAEDLEDELTILMQLFTEQKGVVDGFIRHIDGSQLARVDTARARAIAAHALERLAGYTRAVAEKLQLTRTTKDRVLFTLDIKQKKANLEEARGSTDQGRTMMVFTVFTVVFLPLSFFTSLYGMNIKEWSGDSSNVTGRQVAIYMGSISVGIILIAVFVAFGVRRVRGLVRRCFKNGRDVYALSARARGTRERHEMEHFMVPENAV